MSRLTLYRQGNAALRRVTGDRAGTQFAAAGTLIPAEPASVHALETNPGVFDVSTFGGCLFGTTRDSLKISNAHNSGRFDLAYWDRRKRWAA